MKVASLCFDDGFLASAKGVRAAFESRGLAACFCVLASPGEIEDAAIRAVEVADWGFWREARAAGHEVAPHGWAHERLSELTQAEAEDGLRRTFDLFAAELPGFRASESLFHAAYLTAPEPVCDWLRGETLGVRLRLGRGGMSSVAGARASGLVDCITYGPGLADHDLLAATERFLDAGADWLVLVMHGLEGEGWGPVSPAGLERLLDRLEAAGVRVETPNRVLNP